MAGSSAAMSRVSGHVKKFDSVDLYRAMENRRFIDQHNLNDQQRHDYIQYQALLSAYQSSFSPFKTAQKLNPVDWSDEYAYCDGKKWITRANQKGVMLMAAHPDVEKFGLQKCSQWGASTIAGLLLIYFCSELYKSSAYYLPTDPEAASQSKKVAAYIRSMPMVGAKLLSGNVDKQSQFNTLSERHWLHDAIMYMRGGTSPERFQRIPLEVAFLDEPDRSPKDVKGEGGWLGLIDGRFNEAGGGKVIIFGTPTIHGQSEIESFVDNSRGFIFERWVPCPHCGEMQTLEWGSEGAEFGIKWDKSISDPEKAMESVHYQCINPCCKGKTFNYDVLHEIDEYGEWRCPEKNLMFDDSEDGDFLFMDTRELAPTPSRVAARHSSSCCGLFSNVSWNKGWLKWQYAIEEANNGDPNKLLKPLHNTYCGITFKKKRVGSADIDRKTRVEIYRTDQLPQNTQLLTMGGDFQKKYCDYELIAWGQGRESASIQTGPILGKTKSRDNPAFRELKEIMDLRRPVAGGGFLQVEMACFDENYGTSYIRDFCAEDPFVRIACRGVGTVGHPLFKFKERELDPIHGCFIVNVGAHYSSDLLYAYLMAKKGEFGYCHFPEGDDYDDSFFNQLTADVAEIQLRNGIEVEVYVCPKKVKNEKHDCRKLNIVALEIKESIFGFTFLENLGKLQFASFENENVEERIIVPDTFSHNNTGIIIPNYVNPDTGEYIPPEKDDQELFIDKYNSPDDIFGNM